MNNDTTPASTTKAMSTAKAAATKPTVKKAPAKTPAAEAVAVKVVDPADKATVRTSHADCAHESKGSAGKKARAACRKERAAKAVAA